MAKSIESGEKLFEGDDARREALLVEFEDQWKRGSAPIIDTFLPADDPHRLQILSELVHIDLECRIRRGEAIPLESYFERYPELRQHEHLAVELIESEIGLLNDRGQTVAGRDYLRRFPELADKLHSLGTLESPQRCDFPVRIHCPHCRGPIAIMNENQRGEVHCPECDQTIRLDTEITVSWRTDKVGQLGKFQLERAVGRGAFGTVYRAHDTDLQRTVAVKVPRSGTFSSEEDERRFMREARSAARLSHPSIVHVHEVGRSDGLPYIVTEFVEGVTLADALTARQFTCHQTVQLILSIADALQHAHESGVVHRDLKPSNIMLTPRDEVRIMDFGLAKRDVGDATATVDGQLIGTPAYMSPEQALGKGHLADKRIDIYSLGVIFFELLTGQRPFTGNSSMLVYQVVHEDVPVPREVNLEVPEEISTICLKCLERDPNHRYQSIGELADELRRVLDGRPIRTRDRNRSFAVWRWCRKYPVIGLLLVALSVVLILMVHSSFRGSSQGGAPTPIVTSEDTPVPPPDNDELANQATAQLESILHRENPEFVRKVDLLATRIAELLKSDLNHDSIAVGRISGQPQLQDRCGQVIETLLVGSLASRGIICTRRSEFSCKGDYAFDPDFRTVEINLRVLRKTMTISELRVTLTELTKSDELVRFFDYLDGNLR